MRVLEEFPHRVREIEHGWIPLADGCRLAVRLWLPEDAERVPVPAVIEYIPYGKRIGTRDRDESMHRWFAGHGIAALRIDLRGSGESEGVLRDEYLPQEQEDGVESIAWVAAQPWCTGQVGLMGKSWGGFNALQIAARRPPHLKAILTACSTDDRYADDVHYMGGCLLNDSLWWGAVFFQLISQPPDPELVGPSWRSMWQQRLEAAQPPPLEWMRHPLRDEYWKQGSICEDYGAIECPVFLVGGWADGYSNAILRLAEHLRAPRHGLIGPWGHAFPHDATPGPSIGFLQEAARFWMRFLSSAPVHEHERTPSELAGSEDHPVPGHAADLEDPPGSSWKFALEGEPLLRIWMQESIPAGSRETDRPGRWIGESEWPSTRISVREFGLSPGRLGDGSEEAELTFSSSQDVGRAAGGWLVAGTKDQQEDDERSLCFDSDPLPERLEILGSPELHLCVASDRDAAFVAARLCDVAPDGTSLRVTYGILNLTHSPDHESWTPLVPGRPIDVVVRLNDIAHAFPAGHRLRISLSNAYWPLVWPSPQHAALTVHTGKSHLRLPIRPPRLEDATLRELEEPEQAAASEWTPLTHGEYVRRTMTDPDTGDLVTTSRSGFDEDGNVAMARLDIADITGGDGMNVETRIHPEDPTRASASMMQRTELRREEWQIAVETEIRISCTNTEFLVHARLDAWEGTDRVFHRSWDERLRREGL